MQPTDIRIDAEFRNFCRVLTPEELSQLRANILEDGRIRDAVTVWNSPDGPVMVDGHNRLSLWLEELREQGVPAPEIELREFASRLDVLRWMDAQQSGRRNETPADIAYRRGVLYEAEKQAKSGAPKGNQNAAAGDEKQLGHNDPIEPEGRTSQQLASHETVSEKTVRRDAEFKNALDRIAQVCGDAARDDIRSGTLKVPKKRVIEIAGLSPVKMKRVLESLRAGKSAPQSNGKPSRQATLVDALKRPVPDDLVGVFEQRKTFDAIRRELSALRKQVTELADSDAGQRINLSGLTTDLGNALRHLRFAAPYTVCTYCDGEGPKSCEACKGTKWITEDVYQQAPEGMKNHGDTENTETK